ncbi:MAG: glycosyltransferase family 2 protein, partial [Gammaproteobacteria bacterium]
MTHKLTILIPTYNRAVYLQRNLQQLCTYIARNHLEREVGILVSNNLSPDDTIGAVAGVQVAWPDVELALVNQTVNIGSVRNVLFLLGAATTEYILYVGDDDYLDEAFLLRVMELLRTEPIAVIVPSNVAITIDGDPVGYGRDVGLPERKMEPGLRSCLYFAWRGHQMSGLVFRREGLMDMCRRHHIDNMYLFIYLVAVSALRGVAVHLTAHPVKVSTPTQQAKGWSYGDDGLLGDVFANFAHLDGIGWTGRSALEMKFLWVQYWRYAMYLKVGLPAFCRCLWRIVAGTWTSPLTRVLFPLSLPLLLPL